MPSHVFALANVAPLFQIKEVKLNLHTIKGNDKLKTSSSREILEAAERSLHEAADIVRKEPETAWRQGLVATVMRMVEELNDSEHVHDQSTADANGGLLYYALDCLISAFEFLHQAEAVAQTSLKNGSEKSDLIEEVATSRALSHLVRIVTNIEGHDGDVLELAATLLAGRMLVLNWPELSHA